MVRGRSDTGVNCHCWLEENPVGNVEPMQLVVYYLTKAAIKLPRAAAFFVVVLVGPVFERSTRPTRTWHSAEVAVVVVRPMKVGIRPYYT